MSRCLIICALLLSACGASPNVQRVDTYVPADLLMPCPGWQGAAPVTEGELIDAVLAEKRGREACNARLQAISEIVAR